MEIEKYTFFDQITENKKYNFFGIIYDATFPVIDQSNTSNLSYEVTIKLFDPSVNCLTYPDDIQRCLLTLIVKSNKKETIPFIHNVGDIIKVENGLFNPEQRCVVLAINTITKLVSSWAIFSGQPFNGSDPNAPNMASDPNMKITPKEIEILGHMRFWSNLILQLKNSLNYPNDIKLSSRKENESNSSIVQVADKIDSQEEKVYYIIQDETERCELSTVKDFNFLKVGDVIRLSGYGINGLNKIEMKNESNILVIPKWTNCYKSFEETVQQKLPYLDATFNPLKIIEDIEQLFNKKEDVEMKESQSPSFPKLILNDKDKELYAQRLEEIKKDKSGIIKVKFEKILYPKFYLNEQKNFNITFLCKENNEEEFVLHFCDFDGQGEGLLRGVAPEDWEGAKKVIEEIIAKDSCIEVMVEGREIKMISEKNEVVCSNIVYRIIGKYSWE